jgi:NADPH-dependent 2,4-dienoyl-CoA reductase/sulfur reductase-like enzyme
MSRAWLADPEFSIKAHSGRAHLIRRCIGTNECHAQGRPLACTVNAAAGREEEFAVLPTSRGRSVAVVGGGVAGMEAATVAANRGHNVVLFERDAELGGVLRLIARNPGNERLLAHLQYMADRAYDAGVNVKLGHAADVDAIATGSFDHVVVATGSQSFIPDVPGITGVNVVDARDVLAGAASLGGTVAVIAGPHRVCCQKMARPHAVADPADAAHRHDQCRCEATDPLVIMRRIATMPFAE